MALTPLKIRKNGFLKSKASAGALQSVILLLEKTGFVEESMFAYQQAVFPF